MFHPPHSVRQFFSPVLMSLEKILSKLNPAQQEAVRAIEGPVLIVAGAGSGKTRVLTYRVAAMIELGISPFSILALTFTNKAANVMKRRIIDLVGERSRDVSMGTFHSQFARVLRSEADKLGYNRSFTIYDSEDSLELVKMIMGDLGISTQQFNPHAVRSRISGAKNRLVLPQEYLSKSSTLIDEKTAAIYEEYNRRLRMQNAMDFDDLLIKPIELFQAQPNVLRKYQSRFKYVLVDEFQDTNHAQFVLLDLLAAQQRNLSVVGDDAQSIYSFRGADIRNILDFERTYTDCRIFRLEENYRSTKTILAAAASVIRWNADQIQKKLWTSNPEGDPVTVLECEDERDEGYQLAKEVEALIARGSMAFRDIAVVYRTNAQSRSIEDALRRCGITYTIIGGVEFYLRKEIKDVLAYLRIVVNPADEESLLRAANTPPRGIGDMTLRHLRQHAAENHCTLFDAMRRAAEVPSLTERARRSLLSFTGMLEKYISFRDEMSASELSRSLVDELGFLTALKAEGTAEALARWENVQELLSALSEFSESHERGTLVAFLEEVSLVSAVDRWEEEKSAVTLMTLHSAKGLEFPVVFIVGLEEGLLPLSNGTLDRSALEEERRLFYVGMTRAREKLYLSYARTRFRFGDRSYTTRSRFLDEIGAEYLEHRRSRGRSLAEGRRMPEGRLAPPGAGGELYAGSLPRSVRMRKTPAARPPRSEESDWSSGSLRVGMIIYHESFGRGRIIQLSGEGDLARAAVAFDEGGKKLLLLKYARLRLEGE